VTPLGCLSGDGKVGDWSLPRLLALAPADCSAGRGEDQCAGETGSSTFMGDWEVRHGSTHSTREPPGH
jgi:hypothetical protein